MYSVHFYVDASSHGEMVVTKGDGASAIDVPNDVVHDINQPTIFRNLSLGSAQIQVPTKWNQDLVTKDDVKDDGWMEPTHQPTNELSKDFIRIEPTHEYQPTVFKVRSQHSSPLPPRKVSVQDSPPKKRPSITASRAPRTKTNSSSGHLQTVKSPIAMPVVSKGDDIFDFLAGVEPRVTPLGLPIYQIPPAYPEFNQLEIANAHEGDVISVMVMFNGVEIASSPIETLYIKHMVTHLTEARVDFDLTDFLMWIYTLLGFYDVLRHLHINTMLHNPFFRLLEMCRTLVRYSLPQSYDYPIKLITESRFVRYFEVLA